jgi:hypothetical protein
VRRSPPSGIRDFAENFSINRVGIRLVIPYPPGGASSLLGGVIVTSAERYFGQPMIPLIRHGGGGIAGAGPREAQGGLRQAGHRQGPASPDRPHQLRNQVCRRGRMEEGAGRGEEEPDGDLRADAMRCPNS